MNSLPGRESPCRSIAKMCKGASGARYRVDGSVPYVTDAQILAFRVWRGSLSGGPMEDKSARSMAFKKELYDWGVEQLRCPDQEDGFSCGLHVLLNAAHVIAGRKLPEKYSARELQSAREHVCFALMTNVLLALKSGTGTSGG